MDSLAALTAEVIECRTCPRLVEWREQVAREKRAAFRDEDYWGRPIPGFGDPAARLLIDLKSRLQIPDLDVVGVNGNGTSTRGEVRAALNGLGYDADEIRDALAELPSDGEVEDLLRQALKLLATSR